MNKRKIFIGAAWPYANGSLHLGHVAALLGADILARYFRSKGEEVLFVSGSDCHGTPIALEADRLRVNPSEIADKYHEEFVESLVKGLQFSYDLYTKTTTENHKEVVQEIFLKLLKDEVIYTKTEELPYCPNCKCFLPDRYIEGECPICHYESARGDQCDECGSIIDAHDLIQPRCKICGSVPEWRSSEHFFLRLSVFEQKIKDWIEKSGGWRPNAKNFTLNILKSGLIDRGITRDIIWGVPIPLPGYESKSIYVWFEAVCGYLSASKELSKESGNPELWKKFWVDENAVHYYVHGKDNIPFHTIIWPAILLGYGGLHLPDRIISSEYLTLEGKQFSKSRHWAVWLPEFIEQFDAETLRYYLVANGPEMSDADFSWGEYQRRTNSELIGNFANFIYRTLSFIKKHFSEGVRFPEKLNQQQEEFLNKAEDAFSKVGSSIEKGNFREGLRSIFQIVEHGNRYINDAAPWSAIKNNRKKAENDLAVAGHIIKCLAILINPFLPKSSEQICNEVGFNFSELKWSYPSSSLLTVSDPKPLYKRIEAADVEKQRSQLGK